MPGRSRLHMRRRLEFGPRPNHCFGCGPDNAAGLRLEFFETDAGVEIDYVAPDHLAGAPGVVHGGVQATLLDEAMCMAAYAKTGTPVLTGELTVRYLHAAPAGEPLRVEGRITGSKGRSLFIAGAIRLAATGQELTRAHGRFFPDATRTRDPASGGAGAGGDGRGAGGAAAAPLANDPAEGET